jgi:hypothetical protein
MFIFGTAGTIVAADLPVILTRDSPGENNHNAYLETDPDKRD